MVLAVDQLFMGDTDWEGARETSAWELFGHDLDGHWTDHSSVASPDLCQVQPGAAPLKVHLDGPGGIDNSWGRNIMPTWMSLAPDFSAAVNDAIAAGDATFLLKIDGLGSAPDYDPLVGKWYQARSLGAAPAWDGSDAWPVASEALQNPGDIESALATFSNSYLTNHTWVSDPGATVMLELNGLGEFPWTLTIHHAVITMELAPDRSEATHGIIAGIIDSEEHIGMLEQLAGYFDPGMCGGSSTFEQIATQYRQASDIMADGTQDPDQLCNGISIGLGFRARPAQLGTVAPPNELPPDPCAGSGGSG